MQFDGSPSIGPQPLIQMGSMLHPSELNTKSNAVDVYAALQALQMEVALCRAEMTSLRLTALIQMDLMSQYLETAQGVIQQETEVKTEVRLAIDTVLQSIIQVESRYQLLDRKIDRLPETYLWPRFKHWLHRIFHRGV